MLYAKALREGINDMPSTAPEVRERVARQAAECGWPAMHEALEKIDPVTAARLAPNDSQRIGRALEVWHMTGRPISAFHADVRRLMKRPDYDPESPARRAVGYRQAIDFIEVRTDMAAFHLAGVAATRQLAKRQMTWMRGMKDVLLMDPEDPDAFNRASALISGLR